MKSPARIPRVGDLVSLAENTAIFEVVEARSSGYVDLTIAGKEHYILRSVSWESLIYCDPPET